MPRIACEQPSPTGSLQCFHDRQSKLPFRPDSRPCCRIPSCFVPSHNVNTSRRSFSGGFCLTAAPCAEAGVAYPWPLAEPRSASAHAETSFESQFIDDYEDMRSSSLQSLYCRPSSHARTNRLLDVDVLLWIKRFSQVALRSGNLRRVAPWRRRRSCPGDRPGRNPGFDSSSVSDQKISSVSSRLVVHFLF